MIFFVSIFVSLHVVFYLMLFFVWKNIKNPINNQKVSGFSIIIPARNEEKNIQAILKCLTNQQFSNERYEIIVIDDFSEDDTVQVATNFLKNTSTNHQILQLTNKTKSGKKYAITKGVNVAKFPVIITTDADCKMDSEWLTAFDEFVSPQMKLIAGPVALEGESIFSKMQQIEYAALMGYGAFTIKNKISGICSGANLAFSKSTFNEVGGYTENLFLPTGDDEFLLNAIMEKYHNDVHFLKDKQAIVKTNAHKSLKNFINQRTRWVSKWRFNKNLLYKSISVYFTTDFTVHTLTFLLTFLGYLPLHFLIAVVSIRFLSKIPFLFNVYKFSGGKKFHFPHLLIQIFYPIYVIYISIRANFGTYNWKGRKY